mmetsp:Transcript_80209/g.231696  ORF Transcript_80209/g.231696 Transcript_80209/m.231696 type:complete len:231 (+) Transcript_80209:455-1147(+)
MKRNQRKSRCKYNVTRMASVMLYNGTKTMPTISLYEATTSAPVSFTVEFAKAVRRSRSASVRVRIETGKNKMNTGIVMGLRRISCTAADTVSRIWRVSRTKLRRTSRSRNPAARRSSTYSCTSSMRPLMRVSSSNLFLDRANILFIFKVSSADMILPLVLYNARIVRNDWSSSQFCAPGITLCIASSTVVISSATAARLLVRYNSNVACGTSKGSPNSMITRLRKAWGSK